MLFVHPSCSSFIGYIFLFPNYVNELLLAVLGLSVARLVDSQSRQRKIFGPLLLVFVSLQPDGGLTAQYRR